MNMLIIFAKEPRGRKIKTRLQRVLGLQERLRLYTAFLGDVKQLSLRLRNVRKVVAFDSPTRPLMLERIFQGFLFFKQKGKDLGQRLHQAFGEGQKWGSKNIVIIGTDAPDIPAAYLKAAFQKLKCYDLVLGPTKDGGYYLVGLNRPHKELFERIPWSTEKVFKCTIQRAQKKKLKIAILKEWSDVDRPQDLVSLKKRLQRLGRAKHTKEYFDGQSSSCHPV